uniref:Uncharacterized protein n=2 Tax=Anguilla anguilla TaxID=7936 RepID=A0A0E9XI02_ANGAN
MDSKGCSRQVHEGLGLSNCQNSFFGSDFCADVLRPLATLSLIPHH